MAKVTMILPDGTEATADEGTPAATLIRILRAHLSDNNGAYMGEAVLCRQFEVMAIDALQRHNVSPPTGGGISARGHDNDQHDS